MADLYKYYLCRPATSDAIPRQKFAPVSCTNYPGPIQVSTHQNQNIVIWGEVLYQNPLTSDIVRDYQLIPDRSNRDIRTRMQWLSSEIGGWEASHLPEHKRITWEYLPDHMYLPKSTTTLEDLEYRIKNISEER